MADTSFKNRMRELVSMLNAYARAYYQEDAPKVSDAEYDALFDELLNLENQTGEVLFDSPTRRVGAAPVDRFEEHTHLARLYSMDKVQSFDELIAWDERIRRLVTAPVSYALE